MATSAKRIFHVGLAGPPPNKEEYSNVSRDDIQAKVLSGADKAREAGYHVQVTFFDAEEFDQTLDKTKEALASGQWDALVIGGGLRMAVPLTPHFERMINVSREVAPQVKILFQSAPGDMYDTIKRGFGE